MQRIQFETNDVVTFLAGQYLLARHPNGVEVPLSIASSPHALPLLELHYRSTPGDPLAEAFDELLQQESVSFSAPQGRLRCPDTGHLLIIVGGTGASTAFCLGRYRADIACKDPTTIFWCADASEDLYATETLSNLANTTFAAIVDSRRDENNTGIKWLVDNADPNQHQTVILSGSPGFVYAATDALLGLNFSLSQLSSDVYDYAPRP
ncbi:MAG: hypothetical protein GKR90_19015 [Pseudomonadales bacterium]|nr:hypothetical protein [Pseudomonadales bacterium]